ncbi:MAG: tadA [Firmicutes bacterium]|nr:tadA [Bacillota bacterium]
MGVHNSICVVSAAVDDDYYMGLALAEARKAYAMGEVPIGAVLVFNGSVLSSAHNMRETWCDATAHAEMIAIQQACRKLHRWRLTGATLYVTIEPCPMCAGSLVMSRIDRLVYGGTDYKAGAVESIFNVVQNQALNHQMAVTAGVRADECTALMKDFFRQRRKNAQE